MFSSAKQYFKLMRFALSYLTVLVSVPVCLKTSIQGFAVNGQLGSSLGSRSLLQQQQPHLLRQSPPARLTPSSATHVWGANSSQVWRQAAEVGLDCQTCRQHLCERLPDMQDCCSVMPVAAPLCNTICSILRC
jgi:hypothetical protein